MIFVRGVSISVVIFFSMSFVAFGVLPADSLATSQSAMADAAGVYLPRWGSSIVAIGAMSAFLTSINGSILVPSRMFFVFSEDRLLPPVLSKVHPIWRTPHVSLIISAMICLGLIWSKSAAFLLNTGLIGIFIIYLIQGFALVCLPYVNSSLYESAQFRPPIPVLWVIGGTVILTMGYFTLITLPDVFLWVLIGGFIGTGIYWMGRKLGAKEEFDYIARMNRDYTSTE